jgi:hypothetical protein
VAFRAGGVDLHFKASKYTLFAAVLSTSAVGATAPKWVFFSGDDPTSCNGICVTTFIDPFSKNNYGQDKVGVRTLTNFSDEAQSATTFGLSKIELKIFDCQNSKASSENETWFENSMGTGRITKKMHYTGGWYSIPRADISLFAKLCSSE